MKRFYFLLSISIIFVFSMLSSCTVEKRLYNKGYHISWRGHKKAKAKDKMQEEAIAHRMEKDEMPLAAPHRSIIKSQSEDQARPSDLVVGTKPQESENVREINIRQGLIHPATAPPQLKTEEVVQSEKRVKAKKKARFSNSTAANTEGQGAIIGGWVFIIIGILLLLFVSILFGILLAVLGIILVGVGFSKKNKAAAQIRQEQQQKEEEKKEALEDVVYLKNGSIIRGTIIEQIPNEQIKIQTAGGSIFVYKIDEIQKITKEKKVN